MVEISTWGSWGGVRWNLSLWVNMGLMERSGKVLFKCFVGENLLPASNIHLQTKPQGDKYSKQFQTIPKFQSIVKKLNRSMI